MKRHQAKHRALRQEAVWDWVWRRRVVYFLTVFATLFLALMPLIQRRWPGAGPASSFGFLIPAISGAGYVLPSFASPWLDAFKNAPDRLVYGALTVGVLLSVGGSLQERIGDLMRAIWRSLDEPGGRPDGWIYRLRTSGKYRAAFYILKHWVLPTVFAAVMAGLAVFGLERGISAMLRHFAFAAAPLGFA